MERERGCVTYRRGEAMSRLIQKITAEAAEEHRSEAVMGAVFCAISLGIVIFLVIANAVTA